MKTMRFLLPLAFFYAVLCVPVLSSADEDSGKIAVSSAAPFRETGIFQDGGIFRYCEAGIFTRATGVFLCPEDGQYRFVRDGLFCAEDGIAKRDTDGKWVYVKDGQFQKATGVSARFEDGEYLYVKDGIFAKETGLFRNLAKKQWINIKEGRLDKKTGLVQAPDTEEWIFLRDGIQAVHPKRFVVGNEEKEGRGELLCEVYAKCIYDRVITDPEMPKREKLLKCFYYIALPGHYGYLMNRIPYYCEEDWPIVNTLDMIRDGGSTCFGFNALFGYLAKLCGYEEVYFCCSTGHAWAEIDGLVYDLVFLAPPRNMMVFETTYEEAEAMGLGAYYVERLRRSKVPDF